MNAATNLSPRMLSPDTQATLLLVARLGDKPRTAPLNRREYNALATSLVQQQLRPGDLLEEATLARFRLDPRVATTERLQFLLGRRSALAFAVEGWTNAGLWVIGRGDPEYPRRVRKILKGESPPIFYGAGPLEHLQADGVGVVGSRDVDEAGTDFARLLGRLCASQQLAVISGAARGVDSEAMLEAVDAGGKAVGVVAGDLARHASSKLWRTHIRQKSVTLLSPFEPSARFTVGYAMERNRYVYTMARFVTVVASASGSGGTWAGAIEDLESGWVPLVVRADEDAPEGNAALLRRGAAPLRREDLVHHIRLRELYRVAASVQQSGVADTDTLELPLDVSPQGGSRDALPSPGADASGTVKAPDSLSLREPTAPVPETAPLDTTGAATTAEASAAATDVFVLVWPHLERAIARPCTFEELKARFPGVMDGQLKAWLSRALDEGRLRRTGRPQRYSHP